MSTGDKPINQEAEVQAARSACMHVQILCTFENAHGCLARCPEAFAKNADAVGEKACHLFALGMHDVHFWACLFEPFCNLLGGRRAASN